MTEKVFIEQITEAKKTKEQATFLLAQRACYIQACARQLRLEKTILNTMCIRTKAPTRLKQFCL